MSLTKPKRCRHTHVHLYGNSAGQIVWCYWCGALRIEENNRYVWMRPTGDGGRNPYPFPTTTPQRRRTAPCR
jgi:hypothetical protein